MLENSAKAWNRANRRGFIGGSDARIIMGNDEAALVRLWREKRGEAEPEDLSGNLIVQLGLVTEALPASAEAECHARTRTMSPPTAAPCGPYSWTPSDPERSP